LQAVNSLRPFGSYDGCMNHLLCLAFMIATAGACAAQPTGSTTVLPDDNDPAVRLLDRLEQRGRTLKSYQARVTHTKEVGLTGDTQLRIGSIDYHAGPPARFRVLFTHLVVDDALRARPWQFIYDGQWLAEVKPDEKQFIRRQIVPPGETYDPLQLGEGPFPFPIGQKRDEVLRMFHVKHLEPTSDDPADTEHLRLTPRTHPETDKPTSDFTTVDIWYDAASLLPVKIVTYEAESDSTTTVELVDGQVDKIGADAAAAMFDTAPPPAGSGWRVEIKPLESDRD